jgi:hypothetical protein
MVPATFLRHFPEIGKPVGAPARQCGGAWPNPRRPVAQTDEARELWQAVLDARSERPDRRADDWESVAQNDRADQQQSKPR